VIALVGSETGENIDIAAWAGRHGGVMLCGQCVERGYDRVRRTDQRGQLNETLLHTD
jgi:hypothetical protein